MTCLDCGAVYFDQRTCKSVFDEFLVLEFTDAGYGAVHFLTVACYMIQHGQYSDEGLLWIEARLRDYLEKGIPTDQIRQQAARETSQAKRDWKVTRGSDDPKLPRIDWSMTIMDVALNYQDAESYRKLIEHWARVTLREMQPLIKRPIPPI